MNNDHNTLPQSEPTQTPSQKGSGFFAEVLKFFLIIIFIIVPFRIFVAQPFIVDGASMDPTFEHAEYLIVDQLTYRFNEPERGSVLIFKYPEDHKQFFIKRVIGLPGETIVMNGKKIRIFNEKYPEGFVYNQSFIEHNQRNSLTITVAEDEYFVLGDNRPVSSDSRSWGTVNKDEIIGRPFVRLLPLTELGIFPGDFSE